MYKQALPLAAFLALAACDGNSQNPVVDATPPEAGETPDPGEVNSAGIPTGLALNVDNVLFDAGDPNDPTDDVLRIDGLPQDSSPDEVAQGITAGTYRRATSLDVPGFEAYLNQVDRRSRVYVAVAATSPDGAVRATSVSDGGQFNIFFRGNHYERIIPLTRPATTDPNGQVSYIGAYAGVTNLNDREQNARLEPNPEDALEDQPFQPRQTQGTAFLNVDFSDNSVEGSVTDRQFTDGKPLPSLALTVEQDGVSNLDDNGEFAGTVEFLGRPDLGPQGSYGGIVGGENASSAAGVLELTNIFSDPADQDDSAFDREVGSFVMSRCGTPGAPEVCTGLSDLDD